MRKFFKVVNGRVIVIGGLFMVRISAKELKSRTVSQRAKIAKVNVRRAADARVSKVVVSKKRGGGGSGVSVPFSVSRPTGVGEVTIVTRSGLVTVKRDGRTVEQFQTTTQKAGEFLKREGSAILSELKARVKPKVESRESELVRLTKSRGVLTDEGRAGAVRELATLRREKALGEKVTRLEQLHTSKLIDDIRRAELTKKLSKPREDIRKLLVSAMPKSKREKGLARLAETISRVEAKEKKALADLKRFPLTEVVAGRTPIESLRIVKQRTTRQLKAIRDLASIGVVKSAAIVPLLALDPKTTVKQQVRAFTVDLPDTVRNIKAEALRNPVGLAVEFATFSKLAGVSGSVLKRSPVGRFILKEKFIFSLPKKFRVPVRTILDASLAQRKFKPFSGKQLSKVNFVKPKTMSLVEFSALLRVLRGKKVDSVVFGSAASRALSKNKTPKPKDLDIAVGDVEVFAREFIKALPKSQRKNVFLRGEKVINRNTGHALFDVKPLSRLRPDASLFGRGFLPVSRIKKVLELNLKDIKKGSFLPKFKRKIVPELEVPTSPVEVFRGVKLTSFGEQTLRKGLGTLQSLLEKNVRRAKDPQAFLISLEIQLRALRRSKSKSLFTKSKIRKLSLAVKLLKSKDFLKLFDVSVKKKIQLEFPIIGKFDSRKVRSLFKDKKGFSNALKRELKVVDVLADLKRFKLSEVVKKSSVLPSILPKSRLPSRLPSKLPLSRIPISKLPSRLPSKLPSFIPVSKLPSMLPSMLPSFIPVSKLPPTKLPPSRIPPSKLPTSRLPSRLPSRIPLSRIPSSKIPSFKGVSKLPPKKPKKFKVKIDMRKLKVKPKGFKPRVFKFSTTIIRPVKISKKLKFFSGVELR